LTALTDTLSKLFEWLLTNAEAFLWAGIFILAVFIVYRVLVEQVRKWEERGLDENASFVIQRLFRWIAYIAVIIYIVHNFGFKLDTIGNYLAVAGGTIIGFAAMNTLGNAISGLIIMTSRPFKIGDRVFYNNQFADVVSIDLIYTKMRTLDNVSISVPNQLLLQTSITNYGKMGATRRNITVTRKYDDDFTETEGRLFEAARAVQGVLVEPTPYVHITSLGEKSVDYTLYFFITDLRKLPDIEAALRKEIIARRIW